MQNTNVAATTVPLYRLRIEYDDTPINPRTDYDNFGKMMCWHNRYNLGDKHSFDNPDDFLKQVIRDSLSADEVIAFVKKGGCASVKIEYDKQNREWVLESYDNFFKKWYQEYTFFPKTLKGSDMVKECILEFMPINSLKELADKKNVILPLYLYDHSGLSISCSNSYPYNDRWDAGQVGWIYASYDDIKKEYGSITAETIDKAEKVLSGEVSTYDDYLRGNVYGYIIEKNGVEVDSCWGYLGDLREMISEMKSGVDKEYQHLFDHVDYCTTEYCEDKKPSIKKQLNELKGKSKEKMQTDPVKKKTEPEL